MEPEFYCIDTDLSALAEAFGSSERLDITERQQVISSFEAKFAESSINNHPTEVDFLVFLNTTKELLRFEEVEVPVKLALIDYGLAILTSPQFSKVLTNPKNQRIKAYDYYGWLGQFAGDKYLINSKAIDLEDAITYLDLALEMVKEERTYTSRVAAIAGINLKKRNILDHQLEHEITLFDKPMFIAGLVKMLETVTDEILRMDKFILQKASLDELKAYMLALKASAFDKQRFWSVTDNVKTKTITKRMRFSIARHNQERYTKATEIAQLALDQMPYVEDLYSPKAIANFEAIFRKTAEFEVYEK